jgi:hypothetical protein
MNRRHNRFVVAAAVVTTAAVLVSPAGAATTAWTSQHLTKAVKSLVGYRNMDSRRDSRQGWKINAVAHTNFLQTGKLHRLAAFRTSATGRLSGLEAQNVIQAELNGGILDTSKTAELPVGSPGAPHGGWMMFTRDGDCYVLYNGAPGVQGDKGAKGDAGEHGAPGLSAYQVWLAEGNTGTVADFMQTITGPKGDQGTPGAPGKDGKDGVNGAMGVPGLSAYEEWLAVGNTGSITDFLHSIVGPQGPKGDKGATGSAGAAGQSAYQAWLSLGNCGSVADFVHSLIGPQGPKGDRGATGATGPQGPPISTHLTTVCVILKGQSAHLGVGAECNGHEQIQVYVAAS